MARPDRGRATGFPAAEGVGIDHDITQASLQGVVSAVNRM
ncbi:alpha-isopropylmalate synthase regulatory domain-containing protein [Luteococcus sp. Sow4_B9]